MSGCPETLLGRSLIGLGLFWAGAFLAVSASAMQLLDIPSDPRLGSEVRALRSSFINGELARYREKDQLGCMNYCRQLQRAFDRIKRAAVKQSSEAKRLTLVVVRDPGIDAWASATGHIFISESFISRHSLIEPEIAMALAHEVMHVLLAHEVFGMTLVKALNPVNRGRPLETLYEDLESDLSMMMNLSPILKEQEHEADEGGVMLAALAGYAPRDQAGLLAKLKAHETAGFNLTHPAASDRIRRIASLLPIASKIHERYGAH
jgi:Zn-dependent protease with chaperone function